MSTESTFPSPDSSRSLSRGTSGTLEGILQQYSQKPELLELILMSKVQEDRRRAEEAKLRSKEIDYVLQRDRDREQASSSSYQHRHSLPSLLSIMDPSKLSSSPPLTNSSLGSPRSVPEPERTYSSAESFSNKDAPPPPPPPPSSQQQRESPSISYHSTLLHPTIVQQRQASPPSSAHHHQQRSPRLLPSLMDTYSHHPHQQRRPSLPPPPPSVPSSSSTTPPKAQYPPIEPMSNMFSRKRPAFNESEPSSSLDHHHHANSNTAPSTTTTSKSNSTTTKYHYYYESTLMPSRNKPSSTPAQPPTTQPPPAPPSNKVPIPPMPMSHTHIMNAKNTNNLHNRQMNHSSKRRRREMQAITMIIETREFPYNDDYLWKNNGNTIHKGSGNKSIYYKCANNPKGCPVNKTVTFKDNGEYLIKYRGKHLGDCSRIKRVVDV
ncbi:hypothetical protein K492DRAFT_204341 [Lichtheimia hyalospora FSU 10163]|nr:hypothetical protein K492DRAFT_204341 [Lichtheimia hyalospora FSU 10163]